MEKYFFTENIVDFRSVDKNLNITFADFMSFLQETSINHASSLGYTMEWYKKNNCAFILTNWQVKVNRYPKYNEKFKVMTYPISFKGILAQRLFQALDENNNPMLTANSRWIYMDTDTRKPTRIQNEMIENFKPWGEPIITVDYKIKDDNYILINCTEFKTTRRDVDSNSHINNLKYLEWVIDLLDDEIYYNNFITDMKTEYKKECLQGDLVEITLSQNKNNKKEFLGCIKNKDEIFCNVWFSF